MPNQQPRIQPDLVPQPAFVLKEAYTSIKVPWHSHQKAQLVAITQGTLTVMVKEGRWILSPLQGVWIPPGTTHRLMATRAFTLCTLYIDPSHRRLPNKAQVVAISPLLRELLSEAGERGPNIELHGPDQRLMDVLLDRLPQEALQTVFVPQAHDPRLIKLCNALEANPNSNFDLETMAHEVGLSIRTAQRLAQTDLGMSLGRWYQTLKSHMAAELLAQGMDVTQVAFTLGYQDVSSFIHRFKALWGTTPGRYRVVLQKE